MVVAVNTFDRLNYASSCLDHLKKSLVFFGEPVKILLSIDYSSTKQDEMEEVAASHLEGLDCTVIKPSRNLGCNLSTYELLSAAFSISSYVVFIEDDILLAKDRPILLFQSWKAI